LNFPKLESRKSIFLMAFSQEALLTISWLNDAVFHELESKTRQRCYLEPYIRSSQITLDTPKTKRCWEATQSVMSANWLD
jgi:hypothetical protein